MYIAKPIEEVFLEWHAPPRGVELVSGTRSRRVVAIERTMVFGEFVSLFKVKSHTRDHFWGVLWLLRGKAMWEHGNKVL